MDRPDPSSAATRLLLPIDAATPSRWAIRHVLQRAAAGECLSVCLLYAVAPVSNWEVVRFRSERELTEFAQQRAAVFIGAAAEELRQAGVACDTVFREADPETSALDLAEELGCSAIVIPRPEWFDWFSRSLAKRLHRSARTIPVILVNADGEAAHP